MAAWLGSLAGLQPLRLSLDHRKHLPSKTGSLVDDRLMTLLSDEINHCWVRLAAGYVALRQSPEVLRPGLGSHSAAVGCLGWATSVLATATLMWRSRVVWGSSCGAYAEEALGEKDFLIRWFVLAMHRSAELAWILACSCNTGSSRISCCPPCALPYAQDDRGLFRDGSS